MKALIPEMNFQDLMAIFKANNPRPFNKADWMAFSGCDGDCPMIADLGDDSLIVLDVALDDATIQVYDFNEEDELVFNFTMSRSRFNALYPGVLSC